MAESLNVLLLEDREHDAELVLRELRLADFEPVWARVDTEDAYARALTDDLDVVLADYQLPRYDAPSALRLHRERGLDVPFILVSGTIGEQAAVEMMKHGAADYVLKEQLGRIGSVVRRSLEVRNVERQRREAVDRFRTVVELCPDMIAIHAGGTIEFVNPTATRMTGFRVEDLVGKRVFDFVHPDSRAALARISSGALVEGRLRRADGGWIDVEVTTTPIAQRGKSAILAILRDVTAKKRAEGQYRELFERAPIGLYRTGADGSILAANSDLAQILGYPDPQSMIGLKAGPSVYAVPEERAEWVRRVLTEGVVTSFPMRFRRLDGSDIWVENSVRTVSDPSTGETVFEGAVKDVSERVRAQAELEERTGLAQFTAEIGRALTEFQTLPDMLRRCAEILVERLDVAFARFWTLDEEESMLVLRASAGMYTHLDGAHACVPVGKLKIGLIASERQPHLTNAVIGDPRVSDQEWARREGMISFAGHPLIAEDRLLGVMAMFSKKPMSPSVLDSLASISSGIALAIANRNGTEALRRALVRAESADRLKSEFLANMSHEIRTPLNVILGYNALIADELEGRRNESLDAAIDAITRASYRLMETVYGILDLSRIESGDFRIGIEPVDVGRVLLDSAEQYGKLAAKKGIAIRVERDGVDARAMTDDYCLRKSFDRVLDNAVKFTDSGEIVARLGRDDGGALVVAVADTGVGIDPAFLPRVFQAFSQEEGHSRRRYEGSGIGLALVKRYMALAGAEVSIASEKAKGTTVTFRFSRSL